ncbi:MAG: alternative ribosome rescue aminoacyl-tRNA hydrolase ArfB [bacterium]|nr:alternative ribosome rescue aminoacyl-tRNA hydrolase ArfB [bacterium]
MDTKNIIFESEFYFKTSRSGGKGGQNVNKVETKVELNFDVTGSGLLSEIQKEKILTKFKNRIDKNDVLKITAQTERSQYMNKLKAIKKFYELLEKAFKVEKIRKKIKLSRSDKEKRLTAKKTISEKKNLRRLNPKDLRD